ncbi:hypothetical protein [Faecalibaculum rodentium]|uniref:hypothetical protein n=1 Tax=Faecalibaculum rodentium TaxID=1702221 RepID=UPI0027311DC1|nr:hypothetical protein [Faecalibaculum rodentium]
MMWLKVDGRLLNADHVSGIRPVYGPSPAVFFELPYRIDNAIKRLPTCVPVEEVINSIIDQHCAGKDVIDVDVIVALHEALKEDQE